MSVAKETGLCLALSETHKTGFVAKRPICSMIWVRLEKTCLQECRPGKAQTSLSATEISKYIEMLDSSE